MQLERVRLHIGVIYLILEVYFVRVFHPSNRKLGADLRFPTIKF
jgi:hypothetical protein